MKTNLVALLAERPSYKTAVNQVGLLNSRKSNNEIPNSFYKDLHQNLEMLSAKTKAIHLVFPPESVKFCAYKKLC